MSTVVTKTNMPVKLCKTCREGAVIEEFDDTPDGDMPVGGWDSEDGDQEDSSDNSNDAPSDRGSESDSEDPNSGGSGTGASGSDDTPKSLDDAIKDAIKELSDSNEIRETVEKLINQINSYKPETITLPKHPYSSRLVLADKMLGIKNALVSEFSQLKDDCEPGWVQKVDSGRLNLQRYISSKDPDEAFDVWKDNKSEATDIEVVVLVDVSASMNPVIDTTMQGMWAIKNALGTIDIPCTVITYSSFSYILYGPREKAHSTHFRSVPSGGGTCPDQAISQAMTIFYDSTCTNRILISITDGDWFSYNTYAPSELVSRMNDAGVYTAMLYMPTIEKKPEVIPSQNHTLVSEVADPKSIVQFIRELVSNVIKQNM